MIVPAVVGMGIGLYFLRRNVAGPRGIRRFEAAQSIAE
jgi:hypothetical protein